MSFLAGLTGLTSAASALGAAEEQAESVRMSMANRTPIHIAPVGVNLGAILAPFNEGSPANGGYGLDVPSRYASLLTPGPRPAEPEFPWPILLIAGGAAGLLVLIMRR